MNKKGFTLVELIVSFAMISILSLVVFKTTINIQQKQLRNMAYSNIITFHSGVNEILQYDLVNKIIEELEFCGRNCYRIKYAGDEYKKLTIDPETGLITYGGFIERLPKAFKYDLDMTIKEDILEEKENGEFDSMLTIRVPISSHVLVDRQDLFYTYQYNRRTNPIVSKIG